MIGAICSVNQLRYGKKKLGKQNRILRFILWVRDSGICYYCRKPIEIEKATIDHKTAKIQCGKETRHDQSNLVMACETCNYEKGGRTVEQYREWIIKRGLTPSFGIGVKKPNRSYFQDNLVGEFINKSSDEISNLRI